MFLGLPGSSVWSGACVSYASMGHMQPCNVSMRSPHLFGEDGFNLMGYSRDGFNRSVMLIKTSDDESTLKNI